MEIEVGSKVWLKDNLNSPDMEVIEASPKEKYWVCAWRIIERDYKKDTINEDRLTMVKREKPKPSGKYSIW